MTDYKETLHKILQETRNTYEEVVTTGTAASVAEIYANSFDRIEDILADAGITQDEPEEENSFLLMLSEASIAAAEFFEEVGRELAAQARPAPDNEQEQTKEDDKYVPRTFAVDDDLLTTLFGENFSSQSNPLSDILKTLKTNDLDL